MNWLLGARTQEPETPVHRWALNAFRGAILLESPMHAPQLCDSPAPANGLTGTGILKTPGQSKKEKRSSVKFHKSVQTPPKATARSGLPHHFPGKFPSPWTPKTVSEQASDHSDEDERSVSPVKAKQEQGDLMPTNSLKALSLKIERGPRQNGSSPRQKIVRDMTPMKQNRTQSRTLDWNVEQGFEEVLDCVTKNNAYLRDLVREMQETQSIADESMYSEGISTANSEVTVNLDEPTSRSGHYWKNRFLELNALTQQITTEQANMERALLHLKSHVETRQAKHAEDYKDRHDLLVEELAKERKANKTSSQMRLVRDLRRQIEDLQTQDGRAGDLESQLKIADRQIADLQRQLTDASAGTADERQPMSLFTKPPATFSPPAERVPSSTSRRVEGAGKRQSSFPPVLQSLEPQQTARRVDSTTTTQGRSIKRHSRFGSKTGPSVFTDHTSIQHDQKSVIEFQESDLKRQSLPLSTRTVDHNTQSQQVTKLSGAEAATKPITLMKPERREAAQKRVDALRRLRDEQLKRAAPATSPASDSAPMTTHRTFTTLGTAGLGKENRVH